MQINVIGEFLIMITPRSRIWGTGQPSSYVFVLVSVCGKRLTRGMSAPASAPAVSKKPKSAKPKIPANHPPVIDMFDVEKLGPHIRRGIVHAVEKGILVRVGNKGKGASGSFKVAEKKTAVPKPKPVKKPKVVKAKKPAAPKKPKAAKKPAKPKTKTPSKPKAAKKPKKPATPKKAKTPKKPAAKKTPKKK
ncbi:hypothetical protein T265_03551 [Opisthorchis viverrini]|uniref:H15 domain-containing protein n=1 Tax=Opisthorchis viverrini TaxID=6198 RepID=A0A075A308_OPIVI|nr:hypothetical protein T265_03551 [Opisthorchis viverrini]KER29965.1 hypothetical protein T265_03551 [Opisthorchis viverrini]